MVSNLAIGLISAADTYGRYARPRQEALARAQVQRELQEEANNAIINDMFAISKTMQNATEEEKNTLRNRLNKFSSAGLQKMATVHMTGVDLFTKQPEGSYGIKPLTTSKPTEGDKQRRAFLDIVSALQHGNKQGQDILTIYKSLPNEVKILGRRELEGNLTDHQGRVAIAQDEKWINVKPPLGEDPSSLPTYTLNENFITSPKGQKYFGGIVDINDTDAIRKLLYGDLVNTERAARYFRALSGSPNARKFVETVEKDAKNMVSIYNDLDEQSIAPTEDSGIISTSTDVLSSRGFNELTNTYTQDYFKGLIDTLDDTPRSTIINGITSNLVDRFSNKQYLNSDRKTAEDYIREYIASQFDLAMEQKVQ